ncbi:MAG: ketopantoate reductase family protein [Candidatus Binatia bacterium]
MKVLVMGAGAVGCFYGGKLAHAGHDVIFIARGENLAMLQTSGLTIKSVHGDLQLAQVTATDRLDEVGICDLVLICVKSYDTKKAAELIQPAVGPSTLILSLQNGVENEDILTRALGAIQVLGGMVYIGAELTAPGTVLHSFSGRLVFGERHGKRTTRAEQLEKSFLAASIQAELSTDITTTLWDKLMWNAAFNAVATLTRSTVGEVLTTPHTRALIRETMREVIAVARAQGLPLATSRADEHIESSQSPTMAVFPTSMAQDLRQRKRLEYDALNGAVVRFGERFQVSTPLNKTFCALLAQLDTINRRSQ